MNIVFLIIAIIAAIMLAYAVLRPGCGFFGLCRHSRWLPVIIWLIVLAGSLIIWRSWTPVSDSPDLRLTEEGTVIEEFGRTTPLDTSPAATVQPAPVAPAQANATAAPATSTLSNNPATTREKIDNAVDRAADRVAYDVDKTVDNVRDKADKAGDKLRNGADRLEDKLSETWNNAKDKSGRAIEDVGESIEETGARMQRQDKADAPLGF